MIYRVLLKRLNSLFGFINEGQLIGIYIASTFSALIQP